MFPSRQPCLRAQRARGVRSLASSAESGSLGFQEGPRMYIYMYIYMREAPLGSILRPISFLYNI